MIAKQVFDLSLVGLVKLIFIIRRTYKIISNVELFSCRICRYAKHHVEDTIVCKVHEEFFFENLA